MSGRLIRWETPFADTLCPSVVTFVSNDPSGSYAFPLEAIVAPDGIDRYPKYRINFGSPVAFSAMEEMHFPEIYFNGVEVTDNSKACSYIFQESPWLESYLQGEYFLFNQNNEDSETLMHYVIFGGDDVLQVVTRFRPEIIEIAKPGKISIELPI